MSRAGWRPGFTVIELLVALLLGGVVLLGARTLLVGLADDAGRLLVAAGAADREANGERVLRSLVGRIESGSAEARFGGDEQEARFTTWCAAPGGWLERCRVRLRLEATADGRTSLVAHGAAAEPLVLLEGGEGAALRYLDDAARGGRWFRVWGDGITVPLAIGVIVGGDTLLLRIGERG